MGETYVECLVARKPSITMKFFKILLIMITVVFLLLGVAMYNAVGLIIAVAAGVGAYFVSINADIEYEYLYVDKEISVDKVLAKSRRKKAGTFQLEQMEIFAPLNSHRLDSYRNAGGKVIDYSSGIAAQPERRYMMVCNGNTKVILEPNEELIRAVRNIAPRKVFDD